jgi:leucyl aminopeptidase
MKISFSNPAAITSGVVVVGVNEGNKLSSSAAGIDKASGGSLMRAIKASTFKGKKGQMLELLAPSGVDYSRILLVGLGNVDDSISLYITPTAKRAHNVLKYSEQETRDLLLAKHLRLFKMTDPSEKYIYFLPKREATCCATTSALLALKEGLTIPSKAQ